MEDLRENCPFESFGRIPGKQRQVISVSSLLFSLPLSLLRYISLFLMAALCVSFLAVGFSFLLRSCLSLFLSPRLLSLLVWHEAVLRRPSYIRMKPIPSSAMRLNQEHVLHLCFARFFFQCFFATLLIESQSAGFVSSTWPPLAAPLPGIA